MINHKYIIKQRIQELDGAEKDQQLTYKISN